MRRGGFKVTTANLLVFEDRPSDSPLVERIWRSRSTRAGKFLSVAASHCEMVVTRCRGEVRVTIRGPETKVTRAECPTDGEWLGIRLALGTYLPEYPAATVRDRRDVDLRAEPRKFWLSGASWEYPTFENAESFVTRLVRSGVIVRDPAVAAALEGERKLGSTRTAQRHFLQSTGITRNAYRQIERARFAARLLQQGASIQDVVAEAGFFDQAHLTRSLRRLIGDTPARLRRHEHQLSFLYNTAPLPVEYPAPSVREWIVHQTAGD